jgi:hypothetical protein
MTRFFVILVFSFLTLALPSAPARADESLSQLVERLQKSPDDMNLREQVIKQAQEEKPAVPEEARRHFIKGVTHAKTAKDAAGQLSAVKSFKEALKIAPWWGDAWYNLAVAQELAEHYSEARASLKLFILTGPGEKEARDAQDRIYALEAKGEAKVQTIEVQRKNQENRAQKQKPAESPAAVWNGSWQYTSCFDGDCGSPSTVQGRMTGNKIEFLSYDQTFLQGSVSGDSINWSVMTVQCGAKPVSSSNVSSNHRRAEFRWPSYDGSTCSPLPSTVSVTLTRQ